MRLSFAARLTAAFVLVGVAAATVTALLVHLSFGARFSAYVADQAELRERQLVAVLADSYARAGRWDPRDLDAVSLLVLMDGGTVRLEEPSGSAVWTAVPTPLGREAVALHRQAMGTGSLGEEQRLDVRAGGTTVGVAIARLPRPGQQPVDVLFRTSVTRTLLLAAGASAIAALLLGLALGRRATRPARQLAATAHALAAGDRSGRVTVRTLDEFGEMGEAFNTMADAVEEQFRLRRAFAADVAHELRTPLAILTANVEGLQDRVVDPTAHAFESLHEEVLRLTRLVTDLETLAAADAAGFALDLCDVDLGSVVGVAVQGFAGAFEAKGVALDVDTESVRVRGDPQRLGQVVANLVSNAVKFTPPAGRVSIDLGTEDGWAVLRVSDDGPGIPADELPHVFERFFRGRSPKAGGSGIGLAVVQELARAHGGDVQAHSAPDEGCTLVVRLPRSFKAQAPA